MLRAIRQKGRTLSRLLFGLMLPVSAASAKGWFDTLPVAAQQMESYAYHISDRQRDPGTFRALAGTGDPQISAIYEEGGGFDAPGDALYTELAGAQSYRCRGEYPLSVYKKRVARFGHDHPYVRQWLAVQKAVLSACSLDAGREKVVLPPPIRLTNRALSVLQADDRAYQAASLLFYQDKRRAARAAFARVGASASPHRATAIYMVAAIDAGSEVEQIAEPKRAGTGLREAEAILRDPTLAEVHPITRRLIGWLAFHVDSVALRRRQMALLFQTLETPLRRLNSDAERGGYGRALADVQFLYRDFRDPAWWLHDSAPRTYRASRALADRARHDGFAAWLLTPPSPYAAGYWADHAKGLDRNWRDLAAYARRHEQAGSDRLVWHTIARGLATDYDPAGWAEIDRLLTRVRHGKDEQAAAALATLFYDQVRTALTAPHGNKQSRLRTVIHRLQRWPYRDLAPFVPALNDSLRYLMASGRIDDARRLRDAVVPLVGRHQADDDLLLLLAEDDAHLAAAVAYNDFPPSSPFLDLLSSKELVRLARRPAVPREARARFARIAWTRLYARNKAVPASLDRWMRTLNADLTRKWLSHPGRQNPADRVLLLDVLRTPALNILVNDRAGYVVAPKAGAIYSTPLTVLDQHDNNWWCAWRPAHQRAELDVAFDSAFHGIRFQERRSPDPRQKGLRPMLRASRIWQTVDRAEWKALARIDSAPKQLTERAIDWVEHTEPSAPVSGQDEALALAVRSTRWGCQRQGGHGVYSHKAFRLLHNRFPASPATKRTPYWFDCSLYGRSCSAGRRAGKAEEGQ